ncbi:MAG: DNA methylase [Chloroflexi bacterium GWB2_49_20]|nr:MAG: DNA methylase [Chloroflexi bacterium GWB2_49_20]OGN78011.1 MAG: DNA methylase [Chloroflexi bacterium GWC2_49_37]OGN85049.1 MAG: DNA methylase [Chloroflexi bacterium GWD2_49_16]HBG74915.1 site-specific DNA-methyltransferase [Anaerolineae bacterium]HCC78361.1 site-specific DNA-methyltransferase [Anaerolineae bacterium]
MAKNKSKSQKSVETFKHTEASRKHIPTAEFQSVLSEEQQDPIQVAYQRRNPDLDPQLVWRGKDMQDWSDLVVQAPPIYIQEKVHPKVLIDDLRRQTEAQEKEGKLQQIDMFADFNGLPNEAAKTEFYQHEANWSNRMILGDSLQVMASLAEREGLRGKVQCIYIDPPYGISFNSNFQWSTTSRTVTDGKTEHITREPEQVKAFRDTWRDGIHSYLTYLRDRLIVSYELLAKSGALFVQMGEENVHRVRLMLDEVFGEENFVSQIHYTTTSGFTSETLSRAGDYIIWYAKDKTTLKYRQLYSSKPNPIENTKTKYDQVEDSELRRRALSSHEKSGSISLSDNLRLFRYGAIDSQDPPPELTPFLFNGKEYFPSSGRHWTANYPVGMNRLNYAYRLGTQGKNIAYIRYFEDFNLQPFHNLWSDVGGTVQSRSDPKIYVVQTGTSVIQRCVLMTTDPGDLVLDPTCGSGTTAFVAEQWGRRWITIDTSRVALALARARIMGARYPYYLLKDSRDGQTREAEFTRSMPLNEPTYGNIRQGFVYERVPHIMLKSIANNAEIDVIWDNFKGKMEPVHTKLNNAIGKNWEEWEIPRGADKNWTSEAQKLHVQWWELRIARQKEIDASIAAKADNEYLYDKPYEDNKKVRVAGPFTVESLSPHRILGVDENDELIDEVAEGKAGYAPGQSFEQMILENLKTSGVQQAHKEDKIDFFSLSLWPGHYICAEGRYFEGGKETGKEKRAGLFIGPEFGTVGRPDLVAAAREAGDAGFDVLVACAFNYDAQSTEFSKLGAIPVLKARMNADLHMADDLKNTGKGNLFVIFGEPDIDLLDAKDGQIQVRINGVDVFHPDTGEVRSDGADGIACWFIDTDYNEESFFVRQAYFLGANDPYSALKTTLKAEINEEAWESLHSDTSRPFDKPESGRIAVKVINHLGDEVMKVFKVKY